MIQLRPYQIDGIAEIRQHLLAGCRSVLYVAPTGSGKTSLTAHMIAGALARNKRTWFTCHRVELVQQSVQTLEESAGLEVGMIASGFAPSPFRLAQVCSIQTLFRQWERHPLPDLLIVDEAHHQASKSWSKLVAAIIARKPSCRVIGLTATPARLDNRGLGEHYEVMVQGPSTKQLIADNYLSPYTIFAPSTVNLSQVHTVAGDYNKAELDAAMRGSVVTGDAVREYKAKCFGKRAVMFLWSVRASEQMAETLNAAGIPAAHIDGTTKDVDRRLAVARYREGRIKVLTNVEIVTEGFDLPAIEACFLLRPTQSLGLYLQMVGRSLRLFPGKERALIFDHSGLAFRHGLPDDEREWSLEGIAKRDKKPQECPVRQCMKCYAVMPAAASKCSACGFEFEIKFRKVEQEDGELQELTAAQVAAVQAKRVARQEQGQADYAGLVEIGRRRGYRSPERWAQYVIDGRSKKFTVREAMDRNREFNKVC